MAPPALDQHLDAAVGLPRRLVVRGIDGAGLAVALGGDLLARADEPAQSRLLAHDARVSVDVRDGRNGVGDLVDVRDAADLLERAAIAKKEEVVSKLRLLKESLN